ncbi:MAG: histone deacetylase family protein [Bdellovibrionota bacterium]
MDDLIERVTTNKSPKYKHYLFVAEKKRGVVGAAIASQFLTENFFFIDYIASSRANPSRGIGAALYARIKEQSRLNRTLGIFLECDSIERRFCVSDEEQKQNKIRLNFYQRFGAMKLENSLYEKERAKNYSMHLLFDSNQKQGIDTRTLEKVVAAILASHTNKKCSKEYITEVVGSLSKSSFNQIKKFPLPLQENKPRISVWIPNDQKIPITFNPLHAIHHVKDKGYVESPIRIDSILNELKKVQFFEHIDTKSYPDSLIKEVHAPEYYAFLKQICAFAGSRTIYPDVFPIRNQARMPKNIEDKAGYYCIDTYSPLNQNAFLASRAAVNCTLTAASRLIEGDNISYALVRPPGHHAERKYFGGFCYLNSTAIAAHLLSKSGKVAILDVDFHHGNGQQDIFYKRNDVLTISIHGHPEHAYPYFTGFEEEKGEGAGLGYNLNYPLELTVNGPAYLRTLKKAIREIERFDPVFCVVALGLDTAKGDPTGTWKLLSKDFQENGTLIGSLKKPTLVVQEGGYKTQVLGINARHFFQGLMNGYYK